ncbi:uncharacterized protein LOC110239313 isoform X2 [Exaiptasia diaphana]|uniref:Uncharacterized protein n=1 Tax=Exaiptasia diaphana TaxID=2652724 RepID=A0A913YKT5_EXADI|nr:uncharacterized protein LOC110239313 isoform X2 [Exaiptasia diaphana]
MKIVFKTIAAVLILIKTVFVDSKWTCSDCAVQYRAIGCYQDHFKRPLPFEILNERDVTSKVYGGRRIDWNNWNSYMPQFACRCAQLAKAKGYTIFGLQFFGECWSGPTLDYKSVGEATNGYDCLGPDYKPCSVWDRHCIGTQEMNYIYEIVPDCDIPLETVGCYKDSHTKNSRPLPLYPLTDRDNTIKTFSGRSIDWRNWDTYMPEFACRCAHKAKEMGKTTFGVQYYGECWTADDSDVSYGKDGTSGNCIDQCYESCKPYSRYCSGKQFANFVYRLAESPCEWKTTPVGCYKEDTSSRALSIELLDERGPLSKSSAFHGNIFDPKKWSSEFPKLLCRCARIAKDRGLSTFGVHDTGTCWGSKDGEGYKKYGKSSECLKGEKENCPSESENCAGGKKSIFVYKVSENGKKKRSFNPKLTKKSFDDVLDDVVNA